jgi:hypothetical protein
MIVDVESCFFERNQENGARIRYELSLIKSTRSLKVANIACELMRS